MRMVPRFDPIDLFSLCRFGSILPRTESDWPPAAEAGDLAHAVRAAVEAGGADALAYSGGIDSTVIGRFAPGARRFTLDTGAAGVEVDEPTTVIRAPSTMLETPIDVVAAALGEPTHSAAPFGFWPLFRAIVDAGGKTVMTGDGADELFGGHAYYLDPAVAGAVDDWAGYRRVRALEAAIVPESLFGDSLLASARAQPWEASDRARQVWAAAEQHTGVERLRFVDVALRMHHQCVRLQGNLCRAAGLGYVAPYVDRTVVAVALSEPLEPTQPKRALKRLSPTHPHGKEPMYTPMSGGLPARWRELLSTETTRRHGLFRPAAVEALIGALDPAAEYLPRAVMVVATAHALMATT